MVIFHWKACRNLTLFFLTIHSLYFKREIQEIVFPDGIVEDTSRGVYLTSKVNSLFLVKSQFMSSSEGIKEKLLTENDEESSLVAEEGFRTT
jgi:hypothetical protein